MGPVPPEDAGQEKGEVRNDNVLGIDVAPTLAQLAGVEIPWNIDGISVVTETRTTDEKPWFNVPGSRIDIDVGRSFTRVPAGATSDLLATEQGVEGAFTLRAHADLVGRPLDAFLTEDAGGGTVRVNGSGAFTAVDSATGVVPVLLTGHVEPAPGHLPPRAIALTLNGIVAGGSELYDEAGTTFRFAAIVSPRHLREGMNMLGAFAVERTTEGVILRPLALR